MSLFKGLQEITHYIAEAQRAEKLAQNRQLREAVTIANHLIVAWSSAARWKQAIWRPQIGNLPEQLSQQHQLWQADFMQAVQLFERAKRAQLSDQGDPTRTEALTEAVNLYQTANDLLCDPQITATLQRCQKELHRRQQFNKLLNRAEQQAQQRYFKEACTLYQKAKQLYASQQVEASIANCQLQIQQEELYTTKLQQIYRLAQSGQFDVALEVLMTAMQAFPRIDGQILIDDLNRVLKGKQHFNAGLLAEQRQDWQTAEASYRQAKQVLPEFSASSLRLGIVAVKTQRFADAVQELENVRGDQALYTRGFAYVKQNAFQQAQQEWQSLTAYPQAQAQSRILAQLEHRERLQMMHSIEQDVDRGELKSAKATSQWFLSKFGSDAIVQSNLENHIQASLNTNQWKTYDWQQIYTIAEQMWCEQFNRISLHNWFVAAFYYAQANPSKLSDLIVAGSMALANLNADPALKDIPWQGSHSVNISELKSTVTELIGTLIDAVREENMQEYLRLRDIYRVEVLALTQISSTSCVRFYDLYFTPGCYNRYQHRLPGLNYPSGSLGALYTRWGVAVAACLDGDSVRAQTIKPDRSPSTPVEIFADHLISYYQGCHHLQNQQWQLAVEPLKRAKPTIQREKAWQEEIDRLCVGQRQQISEVHQHLEFAQFWYNLLASSTSASYLAEYQAGQIRQQLADEKISLSKGLEKARALVSIDKNNPVVAALINDIEFLQDREEIRRLIQQNRIDEAVRCAKRSRHERVRADLMEFFLEILVKGFQTDRISGEEVRLIGRWAYELDPHSPDLQVLYRHLGIIY